MTPADPLTAALAAVAAALSTQGQNVGPVRVYHLQAALAEVDRLQAEVDAALAEGHRRAVEETAIASVHKAVAAEREAVVAYLRFPKGTEGSDAVLACRLVASWIEAGKHHG